MLTRMRRLPIPSPSVVGKLVELKHQAWLDGYESVRYIHLCDAVTTHFPLWLVTFWADVLYLCNHVCQPWMDAKAWLSAEKRWKFTKERVQLAEDASAMLSALPWGLKKCGLSDDEPIHTLWRYLGNHWTTGSMQNDLLHDLANRIEADEGLTEELVVHTSALSAKIVEAFATRETDAYKTAQGFRWLRNLADQILLQRQRLLTMQHLGKKNPHWVAVVIDAKRGVVQYGDALGDAIPSPLLDAYQWWLSQHSSTSFKLEELPIAPQTDTSSCGFLSHNSLEHDAFPGSVHLIKNVNVAAVRMSAFLRIGNQILGSTVIIM